MSRGGKLALGASLIFATAMIYGVHRMQRVERETMHYGIIKDEERLKLKQKNMEELEAQRKLQAELEAEQSVHSQT